MNSITKFISYNENKTIDDFIRECPDFKNQYENSIEVKKIIDTAKLLEGQFCSIGVHASKVVISKNPLMENVPLELDKENNISIAYPIEDVNDIGMFRIGILKNIFLTIIQKTIEMIKEKHGIEFDINNIDFDDEKVYKMLSMGYTKGVFQMESDNIMAMAKSKKLSSYNDLCLLLGNGEAKEIGNKLYNDFADFLENCSNKINIVSNANTTYKTAYLKAYYPVEYMTALLSVNNDPMKAKNYIEECDKIGIKVSVPDINA